uniref:Next to BRCA1 gene 1 protein-like n=1 Tax=Sinocyclocheilus grahami TaxID=75366 RepID=A0A672QV83_SINGR
MMSNVKLNMKHFPSSMCSVCPSCILCEPCSHKHDPSHNLKRTWTPLSVPERGVTPEPRQAKIITMLFLRRGDRTVRKAERQRLKAERRQLKAEVKEIKKKLRLEKRGLLWSGTLKQSCSDDPLCTQTRGPKVSCSTLVPTMTALFLDENLPDGTCLEPGTKFIKYWKMRNTGNISWTSETKLKFMWGNLTLGSREQKEVAVPFLQPGQVGVVSVAFVAPLVEGTYTSHWRLAHCGVQFGPRVWCSIIVVPSAEQKPTHCSKSLRTDLCLMRKDGMFWSGTRDCEVSTSSQREYYFPSVDLLMAQDLLSFELLDINIVQELEKVPANTPADMTPCVSPPFHHGPLFGKHGTGQNELLDVPGNEEGDEDISGTQFVCETVIRSLTLEEEPERKPQRRNSMLFFSEAFIGSNENLYTDPAAQDENEEEVEQKGHENDQEKEEEAGEWDEVNSQVSSASSEDYIVILPDCFDTSRPLGESMYSSAMSQPAVPLAKEPEAQQIQSMAEGENEEPIHLPAIQNSLKRMLCTSQILDTPPLIPEIVPPPIALSPPPSLRTHRKQLYMKSWSYNHGSCIMPCVLHDLQHTNFGLIVFQRPAVDPACEDASMMAVLQEMGFSNQPLNQRLLRKHHYNLLDVVNELVQLTDSEWHISRH